MWLALILIATSMSAATASRSAGAVVCVEVTGAAGLDASDVQEFERAIRAASRRLRVRSRTPASGRCTGTPTLRLTVARFGSNVQIIARLRSATSNSEEEWTEPLARALQSTSLANHLRPLLTPFRRARSSSRPSTPTGDEAERPDPIQAPQDRPSAMEEPTEAGEEENSQSTNTIATTTATPGNFPDETHIATSEPSSEHSDGMRFGLAVMPAGALTTSKLHSQRFEPWGGFIAAGLTATLPLATEWESSAAASVEGTWLLFSGKGGGVGSAGSILLGASLFPIRIGAALPRIDLRAGAAVTGSLLRFTWQGGIGIDFEVDALRIGPSMRYVQILDLPPIGARRADLHAWLFGVAVAWLTSQ